MDGHGDLPADQGRLRVCRGSLLGLWRGLLAKREPVGSKEQHAGDPTVPPEPAKRNTHLPVRGLLARRPEPCRLFAALCRQYVAPLYMCPHPVIAAPA